MSQRAISKSWIAMSCMCIFHTEKKNTQTGGQRGACSLKRCIGIHTYLEETTSALDVSERRGARIAGLEDGTDRVTYSTISNSLVQASERRIITALESSHELDASCLSDL